MLATKYHLPYLQSIVVGNMCKSVPLATLASRSHWPHRQVGHNGYIVNDVPFVIVMGIIIFMYMFIMMGIFRTTIMANMMDSCIMLCIHIIVGIASIMCTRIMMCI